ncbi:flavodoxin [Bacteroidia bacterium]|nr:flavodoxin [Bacteroidia bacterium]
MDLTEVKNSSALARSQSREDYNSGKDIVEGIATDIMQAADPRLMDKVLVVYFSKYGSTKKYAEWIASELNGDIYNVNNIKQNILKNYDVIILGSALYAGKIKGINIIINNYEKIKHKKIIIYTCGLADYTKIENINTINKRLEGAIPENIKQNINIYYLRGGINYKELNLKHKIMMWLLKKSIMKKGLERINEEDKEFINTYGQTIDFTDKKNITEIIKYCKE